MLLEDCALWIKNETFSSEEIAIRFKHKLVSIHLFSNGNGRHSRMMADILLKALDNEKTFTWGRKSLKRGEERIEYLKALKKADNNEIDPLIEFSKK